MKKAILILLLMPFVINAMAQKKPSPKKAPLHKTTTTVQTSAVEILKFFYINYMRPYFDGSLPSDLDRKQSLLRRTYCTQRCRDRYEQLRQESDGDPFVKTDELDAEAIKSLAFRKDPKQPNKYTVTYSLGEEKTIELNLVNVKGQWKIDYIN